MMERQVTIFKAAAKNEIGNDKINVDRTIEFNNNTIVLAAAGIGYIGTFDAKDECAKVMILLGVAIFGVSLLFGLAAAGRATKLKDNEVDDGPLKLNGRIHLATFMIGIAVAAILLVRKVTL